MENGNNSWNRKVNGKKIQVLGSCVMHVSYSFCKEAKSISTHGENRDSPLYEHPIA